MVISVDVKRWNIQGSFMIKSLCKLERATQVDKYLKTNKQKIPSKYHPSWLLPRCRFLASLMESVNRIPMKSLPSYFIDNGNQACQTQRTALYWRTAMNVGQHKNIPLLKILWEFFAFFVNQLHSSRVNFVDDNIMSLYHRVGCSWVNSKRSTIVNTILKEMNKIRQLLL